MKVLILLVCFFAPVVALAVEQHSDAVEGAYYDYEKWVCEIKDNQAVTKTSVKVTILSPVGDGYNGVAVHEDRYARIGKFSARVRDKDGKVSRTFSRDDLTRICGFGTGYDLYSDICFYSRSISLPKYPYSVEYEYETEENTLFFWSGEDFQHYVPVKYASYDLTCPTDFKFYYKVYGLEMDTSSHVEGGKVHFKWMKADIPALKEIKYAPDGYPVVGRIAFQADKLSLAGNKFEGCNWSNIGRWYGTLAQDCYLEPDKDILALPPEISSRREIAKAIYDSIIDNTHYVMVSIGVSGWKPNKANFTRDRGYGDCKGLTTLLVSRLRNAGIRAYPLLALTRGDGLIDTEFPSFQFNHTFALAIIEGDSIWMDPTCNDCPFGTLRSDDEDIMGLVVTDSGGVVVQTPGSAPEDNTIVEKAQVNLQNDKTFQLTTKLIMKGHSGQYYRDMLQHATGDEKGNLVDELLPGGKKTFTVQNFKIENLDKVYEPATIELAAKRERPADELNGVIYLSPDIFKALTCYQSVGFEDRAIPLDLGYPRVNLQDISISWDSTLSFDSVVVPANDSVSYDFGELQCTYSKSDSGVEAHLKLAFKRYVLSTDRFADFENFRSRVKEASSRNIKFFRGSSQ